MLHYVQLPAQMVTKNLLTKVFKNLGKSTRVKFIDINRIVSNVLTILDCNLAQPLIGLGSFGVGKSDQTFPGVVR